MQTVQISFEVPAYAMWGNGATPAEPSRSAQQMLGLFLYEHGKLSLGKACEVGGMSMWEFMEQAAANGIAIEFTDDSLAADLTRLRSLT